MKNTNNISNLVCSTCVVDIGLAKTVLKEGKKGKCSFCNKNKKSVSVEYLAKIIDPIFRKYFRHGNTVDNWAFSPGGEITTKQNGENLRHTIQEILGDLKFEDHLISALMETEKKIPGRMFDNFYNLETNYEENKFGQNLSTKIWNDLENRIKFRQRYFNIKVEKFFKYIFSDLKKITSFDPKDKTTSSVLQNIPSGTKIWRGRKCSPKNDLKDYLTDIESKLGPPPSAIARAGRMNSEGVSVFYGSQKSTTCAAEMRPSIGESVLVAEFETIRPLFLLNFARLDKIIDRKPSYFDLQFIQKMDRRNFIKELHSLISKPVVPGSERDYLMTQALSEYLAHIYTPRIDGLIFNSVQEENGENYVIFLRENKDLSNNNSKEFDLPVAPTGKTPTLMSTLKIKYDFDILLCNVDSSGNIYNDGW